MDCEKFDRVMLDLLYDELDELTHAAAKRHMETCSRCGPIASELRATRDVGVLPMVEAPASLTERILDAERQARRDLPLGQRMGRAVSALAGYAMRPQLAMAALFLLMIGTSLFLLRPKLGDPEAVKVTERGVEEATPEMLPATPQAEPLPAKDEKPRAAGRGRTVPGAPAELAKNAEDSKDTDDETDQGGKADTFELAMNEYRSGNWVAAQRAFDAVEAKGGSNAPQAALFSAQAVRNASGCTLAGPKFETVTSRYGSSPVANDAHWHAATCFAAGGDTARATKHYRVLLDKPGYSERAKKALARMGGLSESEMIAQKRAKSAPQPAAKAKAKPAKPPPPAAAPKPAAKPAPPPQADAL